MDLCDRSGSRPGPALSADLCQRSACFRSRRRREDYTSSLWIWIIMTFSGHWSTFWLCVTFGWLDFGVGFASRGVDQDLQMNWWTDLAYKKIVKKNTKCEKEKKKGNVQCIVSTCFDALIIITVLWYVIIRGRNVGDSYMCFNGLYWMIILRRVTWCGGCVTQADQLFVVKSAVHRPASFMWRGGEWRGSRTLLTARLLFLILFLTLINE